MIAVVARAALLPPLRAPERPSGAGGLGGLRGRRQ